MASAFINAISYWLPENILTNEDISRQHPEWSIDKIASKTGIKSRRFASATQFTSDMAFNVANKLFEEHNIDKSQIDFLLLCTQSPDYFLPTTACIVQDKLGLPTSIGALDFNLGCSGYIYGLGLAKGLIESNSASNVLLITAETYSRFINPNDKSNKTIFGDAAAATLVSKNERGFKIEELVYGTDGSGANNLIVVNGGMKNRNAEGIDVIDADNQYVYNNDNLYMNGSEIFKFTVESVPQLVEDILKKNNTELKEIDFFVFHQANKYMLEYIRKKVGIDQDKFVYFLEYCGNTVSSTVPIALSEVIKKAEINRDSKMLLAGFGVGYSYGGTIITKI